SVSLEYSTNGTRRKEFTVDQTVVPLAKVGDWVEIRSRHTSQSMGNGNQKYNQFVLGGQVCVSGNIMSLLYRSFKRQTQVPPYGFKCLFANQTGLTGSLKDLLMPFTTASDCCCHDMFRGTGVIDGPELPATTLGKQSYRGMFYRCPQLITAPSLPATNLGEACYLAMFAYCTNLEAAPHLPATTLKSECYGYMFRGCPKMNAISLSYGGKFSPAYFAFWVDGVSQSGTFGYSGEDNTRGMDAIPTGWDVQGRDEVVAPLKNK
ncbi:MAG: hypothetical protein J6334_03805, partial [Kiritimatiellae bacterium]|nr:hypothetical protein [Kiritimatiellia bacterium]